jgi:hypothetical protein
VLDAFSGNELVGNLLDGPGLAAHSQHFQAVVVVQANVQRGDDYVVMIVLDIAESGLDVLLVVIVNQGDGVGDVAVAVVLVVFVCARFRRVRARLPISELCCCNGVFLRSKITSFPYRQVIDKLFAFCKHEAIMSRFPCGWFRSFGCSPESAGKPPHGKRPLEL